eukprot:12854965-Alexandrium_andersonii.AAC.1
MDPPKRDPCIRQLRADMRRKVAAPPDTHLDTLTSLLCPDTHESATISRITDCRITDIRIMDCRIAD